MTKTLLDFKDPDIVASFAVLRRAARRPLQIGLETGTHVHVLNSHRIVDLTKEQRRKHNGRK